MNIPRKRRFPMRPACPRRPAYNLTVDIDGAVASLRSFTRELGNAMTNPVKMAEVAEALARKMRRD